LIAAAGAVAAAVSLQPGATFRDCPSCPEMVVIAPGSFTMGEGAPVDADDELPAHEVAIAEPFAAAAREVTRGEFARFVAATGHDAGDACQLLTDGVWKLVSGNSWRDPGYPQQDDHPVACVSWHDAAAYVAWISGEAGRPYRLLSEAEWEYVARAGGDDAPANGRAGEWEYTAPVGSLGPDRLGLYDVRGNLWEWLADCYHVNYERAPADGSARLVDCSNPERRTLRGGSWNDGPELMRASYRLRGPDDGRYFTLGFRIARSLP
jgi:formylglycine-generating enzyme required for sulfatase activity